MGWNEAAYEVLGGPDELVEARDELAVLVDLGRDSNTEGRPGAMWGGGSCPVAVEQFAVGDHVSWNSESGRVEGVVIKKHTHDVEYKGYVHHCTESDPQYEIKSDRTDHIAMHKGGALAKS